MKRIAPPQQMWVPVATIHLQPKDIARRSDVAFEHDEDDLGTFQFAAFDISGQVVMLQSRDHYPDKGTLVLRSPREPLERDYAMHRQHAWWSELLTKLHVKLSETDLSPELKAERKHFR